MMIMMMTIVHQQMFPEREWVGRRIVMVLVVVVVAVAVAVAVVRLGKRLFGGEKSHVVGFYSSVSFWVTFWDRLDCNAKIHLQMQNKKYTRQLKTLPPLSQNAIVTFPLYLTYR